MTCEFTMWVIDLSNNSAVDRFMAQRRNPGLHPLTSIRRMWIGVTTRVTNPGLYLVLEENTGSAPSNEIPEGMALYPLCGVQTFSESPAPDRLQATMVIVRAEHANDVLSAVGALGNRAAPCFASIAKIVGWQDVPGSVELEGRWHYGTSVNQNGRTVLLHWSPSPRKHAWGSRNLPMLHVIRGMRMNYAGDPVTRGGLVLRTFKAAWHASPPTR